MTSPETRPPLPTELPSQWREAANEIRVHNAGSAAAFELCAVQLEEGLKTAENDVLTLADAARESGYHADSLRHMVASGQLPNAGKRGSPRIRRGDLPRRAPRQTASAYDPTADALRLVSGEKRA